MSVARTRQALSSVSEWVGVTAERIINDEVLTSEDIGLIIKKAIAVLRIEPSLLELHGGCRVVGKLYGNLENLLAIFRQFGWPSHTKYVFLGNYIDVDTTKGTVNINVFLMLLLCKIVYPSNILLLRGLSECAHCAADMGMIDMCFSDFCGGIYFDFVLLFEYLPLAALVDQRYFLSCASLSLSRGYLTDYEVVDRPRTTCSQNCNKLAFTPNRLSTNTLRRFLDWDEEDDEEDYRNLRLFLQWNNLMVVVKTAKVEWALQGCPLVEGPHDSLVSFHSTTWAKGLAANGSIMVIHSNLCCTFHPVKEAPNQYPTVKMLIPDPSVNIAS